MFFKKMILFLLIILSCNLSAEMREITFDFRAKAKQIANKVTYQFAKKHRMHICGSGGAMMDCLETMGIDFQVSRKLSQDQARRLIIECANALLKEYNNCVELRPFLQQYPFKPENLRIFFFISPQKGNGCCHPDLGFVATYCGKIFYKTFDHPTLGKEVSSITESFEEALKIVNEQNSIIN